MRGVNVEGTNARRASLQAVAYSGGSTKSAAAFRCRSKESHCKSFANETGRESFRLEEPVASVVEVGQNEDCWGKSAERPHLETKRNAPVRRCRRRGSKFVGVDLLLAAAVLEFLAAAAGAEIVASDFGTGPHGARLFNRRCRLADDVAGLGRASTGFG